jgi:ubiquinone/menaquinone biosynthesis C-methylase UbiE
VKESETYKKNVKEFYNQVGWKKENNKYVDAILFSSTKQVVEEYKKRCENRILKYINEQGDCILDCASGPVPNGKDTYYSKKYNKHYCIDFSENALKEAEKNLGGKGKYILGDITNIPLPDNCMDAVVSLHTIYHVPKDEQLKAIDELYRVLKPGCTGVIIYNFGVHATLINIISFPFQLFNFLKKRIGKRSAHHTEKIYFYSHSYKWFKENIAFDFEIAAFQLLNNNILKFYIHKFLLGRLILKLVSFFEDKLPIAMGRIAYHPLIKFTKKLG